MWTSNNSTSVMSCCLKMGLVGSLTKMDYFIFVVVDLAFSGVQLTGQPADASFHSPCYVRNMPRVCILFMDRPQV